jgi:hypothetical protein
VVENWSDETEGVRIAMNGVHALICSKYEVWSKMLRCEETQRLVFFNDDTNIGATLWG